MNLVEKSIIIKDNTIDLTDKTAIICDDIADTCGTFNECYRYINKNGIKNVICVITHGIFSKNAIEKINKCKYIQSFYVLDSICQIENQLICPKLKVYSISLLLSNVIKRIINRNSISELFF